MTGCTRANKSKLSLPSFALSLHMTGIGSAVSSLVKLRFPALLLPSLALSLHKTGIIYQKKQKL